MRVVSPSAFPGSAGELRRRLLAQFSEPQLTPTAPRETRSGALQVLVDGFMQGSLLTLAVCTPKRQSLFTSRTAARDKPFRTYIVSLPEKTPGTQPVTGEPAVETAPAAR